MGIALAVVTLTPSTMPSPAVSATAIDADPPILEEVAVSPDLALPGDTVTVTWRLSDASGVTFTTAFIKNPSGGFLSGCGGSAATLISGSETDGTYQQSCVIPSSAPSGTYAVLLSADDPSGFRYEDSSAVTFTVTGEGGDADPPTLEEVAVSPDLALPGDTVTVTWRLSDASGVTFTTAFIKNPSGGFLSGCGGSAATLIDGSQTDGTYQQTCGIPLSAPPGTYSVLLSADEPSGFRYEDSSAVTFTVTGEGGDTDPPVLTFASATPTPARPGDTVTLTWRLSDASGVTFTTAFIRNPSGGSLSGCGGSAATLIDGSQTDGTYQQTCVMPSNAPIGRYTVGIQAEEPNGNTYSEPAVHSLEVSSSVSKATLVDITADTVPINAGDDVTITWTLTGVNGLPSSSIYLGKQGGATLPQCGRSIRYLSTQDLTRTFQTTCSIPETAAGGRYSISVLANDQFYGQSQGIAGATLHVDGGLGDTQRPQITSIEVLPNPPLPGEPMTIRWTISDDSEIEASNAVLTTNAGAGLNWCGEASQVPQDGDDKAFEVICGIPPLAPAGPYLVSVSAVDTVGYYSDGDQSLSFSIDTTFGDISPPRIDNVNFSEGVVSPGDTVYLTLNLSDASGIDYYMVDILSNEWDVLGDCSTFVDAGDVNEVIAGFSCQIPEDTPGGTYPVAVRAMDLIGNELDERLAASLVVKSEDTIILSGIVETPIGEPVTGGSVSLSQGNTRYTARTLNDGSFIVGAPADSAYSLRLALAGARVGDVALPDGAYFSIDGFPLQADATQNLVIPSLYRVAITVRDTSGAPASGVEVRRTYADGLLPSGYEMIAGRATQGSLGFEFGYRLLEGVPTITTNNLGTVDVWLLDDFLEALSLSRKISGGVTATTVEVIDQELTGDDAIEVALVDAVAWNGVLRSSTGEPIPGAQVILAKQWPQYSAQTNEKGEFAIGAPVDSGYTLTVATYEASLGDVRFPAVSLSTSGINLTSNRTQDLSLPPLYRVDISVTDPSGKPVSGAGLSRSSLGGGAGELPSGYEFFPGAPVSGTVASFGYTLQNGREQNQTNPNGTIAVWTFPSTIDILNVRRRVESTTVFHPVRPGLTVRQDTTLDIRIGRQVTLSGVVQTADGVPVPAAGMFIGQMGLGQTLQTDEGGRFSIALQAGSDFELGVSIDNIRVGQVRLPDHSFRIEGFAVEDDSEVILTLPPLREIELTVLDRSGRAVTYSDVSQFPSFSSNTLVRGGFQLLQGYPTRQYPSGFGYLIEGDNEVTSTDENGRISLLTFPGMVYGFVVRSNTSHDLTYFGAEVDASENTSVTVPQANQAVLPWREVPPYILPPIMLSAPHGSTIDFLVNDPIDPDMLPDGVTPVAGSIAFRVSGVVPGATITVKLRIAPDVPLDRVPFDSVFKMSGGGLVDITDDVTITNNEIAYQVTDGSFGDEDGVANGIIVDPVVPAIGRPGPQPPNQPPYHRPVIDLGRYLESELPDTR